MCGAPGLGILTTSTDKEVSMSTQTSPFVIVTPDKVPMAFPADYTYDIVERELAMLSEMNDGTFLLYREEGMERSMLLATATHGIVKEAE